MPRAFSLYDCTVRALVPQSARRLCCFGLRSCVGEFVRIDGCDHAWFEERGPHPPLHAAAFASLLERSLDAAGAEVVVFRI